MARNLPAMQETWVQSQVVLVVKNPPANAGDTRCEFNPWVGKIPWRRERLPTLVFVPEESHGQRRVASYSPQCHKELDMTEQISRLTCTIFITVSYLLHWLLVYFCFYSFYAFRGVNRAFSVIPFSLISQHDSYISLKKKKTFLQLPQSFQYTLTTNQSTLSKNTAPLHEWCEYLIITKYF